MNRTGYSCKIVMSLSNSLCGTGGRPHRLGIVCYSGSTIGFHGWKFGLVND